MGCGTAILAMGAAKVTKRKTLAVDIDKESVRVSKINIHVNRLSPLIQAAAGDGYKSHLVKSRGKYDFVFANILAKPLTRMAKDLRGLLAPGGIVILSGLLKNQEKMVLAAHRLHGMRFIRRYTRDGWHSLVLQG
jgi:ribosomal protein L11 methyltransferase